MKSPLSSSRGFSILMALGTTGVLLILVVSLANIFLAEMKLTRLQYDSILSSTQAEGAFEYAMLKIANHKDGFSDTMNSSSPDAQVFRGSTPRTSGVEISYKIDSESNDYTFSPRIGGENRYIVIPLFTAECQGFLDSTSSCDPRKYDGIRSVKNIINLSHDGRPENISWSIVGQSGSENVSLNGVGFINGSTERGLMRIQSEKCLDQDGKGIPCKINNLYENPSVREVIPYFYDLEGTSTDFLNGTNELHGIQITNPYLLIYGSGADQTIRLKTDIPFSLPEISIIAEAKKNNALQAIRYYEDKSKYYDAIKYGVYNTNPD